MWVLQQCRNTGGGQLFTSGAWGRVWPSRGALCQPVLALGKGESDLQRVPPRSHQGCEATTGFVPQTKCIHVRQWERHQDGSAARPCQTPTAALLGNERSKTSLSPLPYLLSSCLKKKNKTSLGQPGRPSRVIWGPPAPHGAPASPSPTRLQSPHLQAKAGRKPRHIQQPWGTQRGHPQAGLAPLCVPVPMHQAPQHLATPFCQAVCKCQLLVFLFLQIYPLFFLFYFIFLPPPFLPFFFLG